MARLRAPGATLVCDSIPLARPQGGLRRALVQSSARGALSRDGRAFSLRIRTRFTTR